MTKTCSVCNIEKDESAFYKYTKTGRARDKCKQCHVVLANERKLERGNELKLKEQFRRIEREFGLNRKQLADMLLNQNGKCLICEVDQRDADQIFTVDHDHNTGRIRGLLCHLCNQGLGSFKDNTHSLQKAIEYINANH